MSGLNPLPTYRVHTSSRLNHAQAHQFLSDFLDRTEVDAAYRPDSIVSERGPLAVSVGSSPNLTLHHLKRILQGIQGKRVGGDLGSSLDGTPAGETVGDATPRSRPKRGREADDGQDWPVGPKRSKRKIAYDVSADGDPHHHEGPVLEASSGDVSDWQDKDLYELAQSAPRPHEGEENVMAEDRHPGADLDQPADDNEAAQLVTVQVEQTGEMVDPRAHTGSSQMDKEERKRIKKLRKKEDKAKRAKDRMKDQD